MLCIVHWARSVYISALFFNEEDHQSQQAIEASPAPQIGKLYMHCMHEKLVHELNLVKDLHSSSDGSREWATGGNVA